MMKSKFRTAALPLVLLLLALTAGPDASALPDAPAPRRDWSAGVAKLWRDKGEKQLAADGAIDVIFLGDSITQLWLDDARWANGQILWDKYYYPKRRAANFGIAGDKVEHLRYRLETEKMTAPFRPRVFVLMIGINNLLPWDRSGSPEEIAKGIGKIVEFLRTAHPQSKILLLGILPALDRSQEVRGRIRTVNTALALLADGDRVRFLDFGPKVLMPDGELNKELIRDTVHLSEDGYAVWADAMNPVLDDMLR